MKTDVKPFLIQEFGLPGVVYKNSNVKLEFEARIIVHSLYQSISLYLYCLTHFY